MSGHIEGGNDTFTGGNNNSVNTFYGDAGGNMSDHSKGGNDSFMELAQPFGGVTNTFYGDAGGNISGSAQGGNDTFTASGSTATGSSSNFVSIFYGDAGGDMSDFAHGGDDVAVLLDIVDVFSFAQQSVNKANGDALTMSGPAVGGNDTLTGGNNSSSGFVENNLAGDAGNTMSGSAHGGNDVLTGGNNTGSGQLSNFLYGDALSLSGSSKGGNDTLYAGTTAPGGTVSNDMWGDGLLLDRAQGGKDQFVFKDNGLMTVGTHNTIEDLSQSQHDQIVFSNVAGVHSFNDLVITQTGTDTVITAGADQVTLHNFSGSLTAHDILFA
jgi:hypothetical protein